MLHWIESRPRSSMTNGVVCDAPAIDVRPLWATSAYPRRAPVYAVRPEVCRACVPGDYACQTARRGFGLR
jgi:hypothetical protein